MPGQKLLYLDSNGNYAEYQTIQASAGAADAGKVPALDSTGKLPTSMIPANAGQSDVQNMTAGEALSAGNFVYINTTDGKVYKADGSAANAAKQAVGYVLTSAAANATVDVYWDDVNNQLSSLTAGTKYYLSSSSAGGVTATAPTTAGHAVQPLGFAISATALKVNIGFATIRA